MKHLIYSIVVFILFSVYGFRCGGDDGFDTQIAIWNKTDTTLLIRNVSWYYIDKYGRAPMKTIQANSSFLDEDEKWAIEERFYYVSVFYDRFKNDGERYGEFELIYEVLKGAFIREFFYTYEELERMNFTIVLDSLTLGLKSPE